MSSNQPRGASADKRPIKEFGRPVRDPGDLRPAPHTYITHTRAVMAPLCGQTVALQRAPWRRETGLKIKKKRFSDSGARTLQVPPDVGLLGLLGGEIGGEGRPTIEICVVK